MRTTTVVVGAGPAGLAASHELTARSIDHVVLERGRVAESWRSHRWDSLRLLTPNWMTRLPGRDYEGSDPDGFMSAAETVGFLDSYARSSDMPVHEQVGVSSVRPVEDGFVVESDLGRTACRTVVIATGASSDPRLPPVAEALPPRLRQLHALHYRRPEDLEPGGVLVVGASASGVQIADELCRSGRAVTLAVGEHVRMVRRYRGLDIHVWMDRIGRFDERYDEVDDLDRARRVPSPQLIGDPSRPALGLAELRAAGVRIVGRLAAVPGSRAQFSGGLGAVVANADLKLGRLLGEIDEFVEQRGMGAELPPPSRPPRTPLDAACTEIDLAEFDSVVWATGYRPRFGFLNSSALDRRGQPRHDGGVCSLPGMYVLGLPVLRRRRSSFIDGIGADAVDVVEALHARLSDR